MKSKNRTPAIPAIVPPVGWNEGQFPIFLTVEETADLLRTTPAAIYTMIERGLLRGVTRIRRRVLLRTTVLLDSLTPEVHAIAGGSE